IAKASASRVVTDAPHFVRVSGSLSIATVDLLSIAIKIKRPVLAAVHTEISSANPAINISPGRPSHIFRQEQDLTNWPRPIKHPAAPGRSSIGCAMNPSLDRGRDFSASHPAVVVVGKEDRAVKNAIH